MFEDCEAMGVERVGWDGGGEGGSDVGDRDGDEVGFLQGGGDCCAGAGISWGGAVVVGDYTVGCGGRLEGCLGHFGSLEVQIFGS